jgi:hypothetical protein
VRESDGRWLAVADLADEPEIGMGGTVKEVLDGALTPLGARFVGELRMAAMTLLETG